MISFSLLGIPHEILATYGKMVAFLVEGFKQGGRACLASASCVTSGVGDVQSIVSGCRLSTHRPRNSIIDIRRQWLGIAISLAQPDLGGPTQHMSWSIRSRPMSILYN
jgi:hypothetical protein